MTQETCNWSYQVFSDESDLLKVTSFSTSPTRITPGQTIECRLQGALLEPLEDGAYAEVSIKLGRVTILQKAYDLNEILGILGKQLPQPEGDVDIVWHIDIAKEIPPAKFTMNLSAYTVNDDVLGNAILTLDMTKRIGS